jgi:hypothetical protein
VTYLRYMRWALEGAWVFKECVYVRHGCNACSYTHLRLTAVK